MACPILPAAQRHPHPSLVVFLALVLALAACDAGAPPQPASFGVGRSQIVISPTHETILLEHTAAGGGAASGVTSAITFFWITGDPMNGGPKTGVDYAIWRFYIDGEANASIVLPTAQAALVGNADPSAPWDNEWFGKVRFVGCRIL